MKKAYEKLFFEVIFFCPEDVVRTSPESGDFGDGSDNFGDIGDFIPNP